MPLLAMLIHIAHHIASWTGQPAWSIKRLGSAGSTGRSNSLGEQHACCPAALNGCSQQAGAACLVAFETHSLCESAGLSRLGMYGSSGTLRSLDLHSCKAVNGFFAWCDILTVEGLTGAHASHVPCERRHAGSRLWMQAA